MVVSFGRHHYHRSMDEQAARIANRVLEAGRDEVLEVLDDTSSEPTRSLATLEFADMVRRAAEQLSRTAALDARSHGASWREIGAVVGGITPQGAEHRFSPSAKERRSKAAKAEWAHRERRST